MSNIMDKFNTAFNTEPAVPIDKQAVASAFGKAAKNYDNAAAFQRKVGHLLLEELPHLHAVGSHKKAIDIGCGTGYFSAELVKLGFNVTAADLSSEMLVQAKQRCNSDCDYLLADAENLPLADNSYDIAFSSLALQWCDDLAVPLKELKRIVRPGGMIFFTTLVDGSLYELKDAWAQVDQHQHVNDFKTENEIKDALAQTGTQVDKLVFSPIVVHYPSALGLMKDLKGIGATHLQQKRKNVLLGRQTLSALEHAYDAHRDESHLLPATYQVCFGVLIND